MPYQTGYPGVSEACLDALKGLIVAGLPDLNTQLAARSAPLSAVTAVAAQIGIGDIDTLPDPTTNPFWITILGGGRQDGRDSSVEIKQSGPGYWYTYWHNIFVYINPDSFPGSDARVQAEARERLRSILQDWLVNDVFNNGTNYTITLSSHNFTSPDTLDEAKITEITKGISAKSFGGTNLVYMLHLTHQGRIYGGY